MPGVTGGTLNVISSVHNGFFVDSSVNFGNTIYVDDDNTNGPWDGTQNHPYLLIQDGVNSANIGDTVYVYSGTYYENVKIKKTISLIGEDKKTTIIDGNGNGYVVNIYRDADSTIIDGFTIQNSGSDKDDAGVMVQTSNNIVRNCTITSNMLGIKFVSPGYYNIVSDCEIIANYDAGIKVATSYTTIKNNNICNNPKGVEIFLRDNVIAHNIISNNENGIFINSYTNLPNTIVYNHIIDNEYGINTKIPDSEFEVGSYNNFYCNNFINNSKNEYYYINKRGGFNNNYWDQWIGLQYPFLTFLPYIVPGLPLTEPIRILRLNLDWNPSLEPFNIGR